MHDMANRLAPQSTGATLTKRTTPTPMILPLTTTSRTTTTTTTTTTMLPPRCFNDTTDNCSTILAYLSKGAEDCGLERDAEHIFQEMSRLTDNSDMRSVDELLLEAERLIQMQERLQSPTSTVSMHAARQPVTRDQSGDDNFKVFIDNLPSISILSEESTPHEMHAPAAVSSAYQCTTQLNNDDDTEEDEDTMEEISEAVSCMDLIATQQNAHTVSSINSRPRDKRAASPSTMTMTTTPTTPTTTTAAAATSFAWHVAGPATASQRRQVQLVSAASSPIEAHLVATTPMVVATREYALKQEIDALHEKLKDTEERLESVRIQNDTQSQIQRSLRETNARLTEETELLKLDVQHLNDCANVLRMEVRAAHKDRDEALELQKVLKADIAECIMERKSAQEQREQDARVIQDLQRQCREMERILIRKHPDSVSALIVTSKSTGSSRGSNDQENMNSNRKLLEQRIAQLESDAKEQDKKAQEILANVQARFNSVQAKYETHIADLETQVLSLQEINSQLNEQIQNQTRNRDNMRQINSEKYAHNSTQTDERKTANCETQSTGTQTFQGNNGLQVQMIPRITATRDHSTNTIGCTTSALSSNSSTANSTPSTSRPNSKQSGTTSTLGLRRTAHSPASKLPISQSESRLSLITGGGGPSNAAGFSSREDAQLLGSMRSLRSDLAVKSKAIQRLTAELEECKKTIRKLQREKSSAGSASSSYGNTARWDHQRMQNPTTSARRNNAETSSSKTAQGDGIALREAQNKLRLLEGDYKTLHERRRQNLQTLQTAHEQEIAACNDTVRVLQQRLNDREENAHKRRKMPVDYYALKTKVSLLERRHSEREERLHMLVEALSKGRLNGALDELLIESSNK